MSFIGEFDVWFESNEESLKEDYQEHILSMKLEGMEEAVLPFKDWALDVYNELYYLNYGD